MAHDALDAHKALVAVFAPSLQEPLKFNLNFSRAAVWGRRLGCFDQQTISARRLLRKLRGLQAAVLAVVAGWGAATTPAVALAAPELSL